MTKKIIKIERKGAYSPKIFFEDGGKAELYEYSGEFPKWLVEGIMLTFEMRPGRFPDCPYIIPLRIEEQTEPSVKEIAASEPVKVKTTIKSENPKQSVALNYQQETLDSWTKKQKQIAIQSSLERATELVCAGKLKLKNLQTQTIENFNLILKYSGIADIKEKIKKEKNPSEKDKKKKILKSGNEPINSPNETNLF